MQHEPLITAYLPTYNRAGFLREALTCLRLQTLSKDRFRVVVADDASTDDTPSVVREFTDLNIVYVRREKNLGFSNVLRAAEFLDTTYFHLLNDDDLLAPWHLEYVLSQIERRPEVGLFGAEAQWGPGLWTPGLYRSLSLGDGYLDPQDQLCHWPRELWLAMHSISNPLSLTACLLRTVVLTPIRSPFEEDLRFSDRWFLALVGSRTTCVSSPWPSGFVRVHGENMGAGKDPVLPQNREILRHVRATAERVLKLGREDGYDLAEFWRSYLAEKGQDRDDIRGAIYWFYPADAAARALCGWEPPRSRLDRWPVPEFVKPALRGLRRALVGQ